MNISIDGIDRNKTFNKITFMTFVKISKLVTTFLIKKVPKNLQQT